MRSYQWVFATRFNSSFVNLSHGSSALIASGSLSNYPCGGIACLAFNFSFNNQFLYSSLFLNFGISPRTKVSLYSLPRTSLKTNVTGYIFFNTNKSYGLLISFSVPYSCILLCSQTLEFRHVLKSNNQCHWLHILQYLLLISSSFPNM